MKTNAARRRGWTGSAALAVALAFAALIVVGCDYGRMRDDEAFQTYNKEFPRMPKRAVPTDGGVWVEREANPMDMVNPAPADTRTVAMGAQRYGFYCAQCHGVKADGNGTVGQSFHPLPTNLRSGEAQQQTDGEMFYKIRFGFIRHPALYSTMTDDETWAVIRYLRSLAKS